MILSRLASNPKTLLLTDAIGAVFSAFFLGVILKTFHSYFGMPHRELYWLAIVALLYGTFSLTSAYFFQSYWRKALKIIASANVVYCLATLLLMFKFSEKLTPPGIIYFCAEVLIIMALALTEFIAANKYSEKQQTKVSR